MNTINYPDSRLAQLRGSNDNHPTESEVSGMRSVINVWSGMSLDQRKRAIDGDFGAYGNKDNVSRNFALLRRFGVLEAVPAEAA